MPPINPNNAFFRPPATSMTTPSPSPATSSASSELSLYVGDLDTSVTEEELFNLFSQIGPVASIKICRDKDRNASLGYAYVNFHSPHDASRALENLNFADINGKTIRILIAKYRDTSNVFIKNLDPTIDGKSLHDIFASFGTILSCKVATFSNGQSKGHGFVQFEHDEAAETAIAQLNGMLIENKEVYVGSFVRRPKNDQSKFKNIYINNLSESISKDDLINLFKECGPISSAVVMTDENGNSKGFGFVCYEEAEHAAAAVEIFNGHVDNDKVWYVGRAQRKAERETELKNKYEEERKKRNEKLQGANLYLKNLDETIDDEKLRQLFSGFGKITSCKVMVDVKGHSKGSGFVTFSSPEEANLAIKEMNGKMVERKPLYVALAQRKEERRMMMQAHCAQIGTPGVSTAAMPSMPTLAPQQLYINQGTPSIFPPRPAGFVAHQKFIPGIHPRVAPNFPMPCHFQLQGQPRHMVGVMQGPLQHIQQHQFPQYANQGFRYMQNPHNGGPLMMPQGPMHSMMPFSSVAPPMPAAQFPYVPVARPFPATAPVHQRMMVGGQVYPRMEHNPAGNMNGRLPEMNQTGSLHYMEPTEAIGSNVAEATGSNVADQLASLSLNK